MLVLLLPLLLTALFDMYQLVNCIVLKSHVRFNTIPPTQSTV